MRKEKVEFRPLILNQGNFVIEIKPENCLKYDFYIVMAYWHLGWWKIFPIHFQDDEYGKGRQKSEAFAANLPKGYLDRHIIHLKNP